MSEEKGNSFRNACAADVTLIRNSGLFDADHYRSQRGMPDAATDALIIDYINHWQTAGVDPAPHFDGASYHRTYAGKDNQLAPLLHFLKHGIQQGFNPWTQTAVLQWQKRFLDDADLALATVAQAQGTWPLIAAGARVAVHVHPESHIVFHEFQSMIVAAFRQIGVDAEAAHERFEGTPALRILIAPHDFFYLAPQIDQTEADPTNCVLFNTEQIPSYWFGRSYRFLRSAVGVLDINLQSAACLAQLGMSVRFLPLGRIEGYPLFREFLPISAEYGQWAGTEAGGWVHAARSLDERPIDILWIGSNGKRRQTFWEGARSTFDRHASFIRLVNVKGALKAGHPDAVSGLAFAALARQSKILLNVHHFDTPYFEWQRLMHFGFLQGACVLTETASQIPGMAPGKHYLQADAADIPEFLDWLLRDIEGRQMLERVRVQGQFAAKRLYDLPGTLQALFMLRCTDGCK